MSVVFLNPLHDGCKVNVVQYSLLVVELDHVVDQLFKSTVLEV
jgi:hypothetical protein